MDVHGPEEFVVRVPTLPPGVAVCDGIPRQSWETKNVTLVNDAGVDVARGVVRSVAADVVIDSDGKPLGDDRVAVQIAESLCEEELPSGCMWSMLSWPIKRVMLNDASLHDHNETALYKQALKASTRRARGGVRAYESSREKVVPDVPPKKESLLTQQSIVEVSTKTCCEKNCLQPFPRSRIQAIRTEIHVDGGVYFRKNCLLNVHKQIHRDATGKEMITLEGVEVCPTAWWTIHGISRATFYRYKESAKAGKRAEPHGNLGSKKPRKHTLQATATLRTIVENSADQMPHKTKTLETGERVVSMCLPSSFRWGDALPRINEVNALFDLPPVSATGLSNIRRESFPEFAPKARGDSFARCGMCDQYKQLRSAVTSRTNTWEKWNSLLRKHIQGQKAHRLLYYANRGISETNPEQMLTIIHDKMDHSKTASPHYSHKNKATDSFMKLPVAVTGMIAHGHGDVRYAHYGLDIFPTDSNHTVGSIAKLLRDLECPPINSSRELFAGAKNFPLSAALLEGADICLDSLLPPPEEPLGAVPLPPILTLQLDNAAGDNKNRYVFAFCSLLVHKGIFREIYVNFLIVGHTHEDIDALFGRWSNKLRTNDYPTLPRLMKSFMDCESHPVIPHLIEEVPDFKKFVQGYLGTSGDSLEGHSNAQQFKFYKDSSGWPLMEYKNVCTDENWLPLDGKGIRLWAETEDGRPKVPTGNPVPLAPHKMKAHDEICKGLNSFITMWENMANDDFSGEYRRKIEPVSYYWKGVRAALNEPVPQRHTLLNGFWPSSRIANEVEDQMENDGTLREEYAEDAPFVGRRRDRPRPSFRVGRDVYEGYFVAVRPADDDLKPFWIARALSNPNPDPGHVNQIRIQYWTPSSAQHIDMDTYAGWDTKEGNVWREDQAFAPNWSSTDCIMTAWKPRIRAGTSNPRTSIPKAQIDIIKSSVAAFVST